MNCIRMLICISMLEFAEEPLVAVNVLATVGFDSGMNGAFGAVVGKRLGQALEFGKLDVLHSLRIDLGGDGWVVGSNESRW